MVALFELFCIFHVTFIFLFTKRSECLLIVGSCLCHYVASCFYFIFKHSFIYRRTIENKTLHKTRMKYDTILACTIGKYNQTLNWINMCFKFDVNILHHLRPKTIARYRPLLPNEWTHVLEIPNERKYSGYCIFFSIKTLFTFNNDVKTAKSCIFISINCFVFD